MAPELEQKLAPGLEAQRAATAKEFLATGATEIRVTLDPPELGRVRVHLEVSDNHAIARIVASSHEAAALLAKDREDLIRAFQNQGVEEVHVQVESDDGTSTRGRDGEDRRPGDGRDGPAPASNDPLDRRTSPLARITRTSLDVFA
jgi:flagellar hook-length control protein FliK